MAVEEWISSSIMEALSPGTWTTTSWGLGEDLGVGIRMGMLLGTCAVGG